MSAFHVDKAQIQLAQTRLLNLGFHLTVDGDFGAQSWAALMAYVGQTSKGDMHVALGRAAVLHFADAGINTGMRIAHCLAQSSVETAGFTRLVENLNYSALRLTQVWPARFRSTSAAQPFANNPEALANKVYGNRADLGNNQAGDGWKYRGRGTKQTTGRANYADVDRITGMPVINEPDLLADPDKGTLAGCVYWQERGCSSQADGDDIVSLTKRINGGMNGLAQRKVALTRAKRILL